MAPELFEHQKEGVVWLKSRPHALLCDEPGLGKSAQLLLSAQEPALVVAPAMVLDSGVWDDEIAKWAPGIEAQQVSYSSLNVRNKRGRVIRNSLNQPIVEVKPEYRRRYRTVVCDESHYLKGRKTSWTAGVFKLDADEMKLATGTPIPNWAHEAFTQLQLIWPERRRPGRQFGSYWRWVKEWFHVGPTYDRAGRQLSPMDVGDFLDEEHLATCWQCRGEGRGARTWDEFYAENWGDRMLLRLREDCLDLPPLTVTPWRVKMGPNQRTAYRQLKKDFITWLESGEEIVAWNQAAQLIKLMKCATGVEVLAPTSGSKGSGKLDALRDILVDRPRPTLVVAHFRDSVAACARVADELGKDVRVVTGDTGKAGRRDHIRSFKSGNLEVLVATIDVIKEGMTLTAADQVVRVERSARPSSNDQVIRRLHRIGQERPVQVIDLISENTVDERILELIRAKNDQQVKALGLAELRSLAA